MEEIVGCSTGHAEGSAAAGRVPALSRLIERAGAQRMAGWVNYRLTLITAAAGYGKTTLASQLTTASGMATAWLRPGGEIADEVELLVQLARSLAALVTYHHELVISQARDVRDSAAAWNGLRRALTLLEQPCCLVIDDCHELAEPLLQQLVSQLLTGSPPNLHWMLLTRRQLPIALSHLRLNDTLFEIDDQDLRLEASDVAQFLRLRSGAEPSVELVNTMLAHCDGWIAGLKLTLLGLPFGWQGDTPASGLIQQIHMTQTVVADYFNEEIIDLIAPDVRDFLLQIAFLPRFSVELCEVVTGNQQSAVLVSRLLAENLFIQPDGTRADWYRLHRLLRATLNRRAVQLISADSRRAAARRAGEALVADGQVFEAAQMLQDRGDTDGAVALIRDSARRLLIGHEVYELQRLFALLPAAAVQGDAEMLLFLAWQLALSSDILRFLQTMPLLSERTADLSTEQRDEVTALELLAALVSGQLDGLARRVDAALESLDAQSHLARGWINVTAAMNHSTPANRVGASLIYFTRATDAFRRAGALMGGSVVFAVQAVVLHHAAEFDACVAFCREVMPHAARLTQRAVALDTQLQMLKSLTDVLYLRNETDAAAAAVSQWTVLSVQLQQPTMLQHAAVRRGLCLKSAVPQPEQRRLVAQVLEWLDEPLTRERPAGEQHWLIFDTMVLALRCGERHQLPRLLAAARLQSTALAPEAPALHWLMSCFARVLSREESPELTALLADGMLHSDRDGVVYLQMWLFALSALHYAYTGRPRQARAVLSRGLPLIGRSGAVRIVLDLRGLLPVLRSVDTRLSRRLAEQMLTEMEGIPLFTPWEERIVALLADERRPAEIAAELGVVVSTVRYHLTSIYRKLGVDSRTAAIARLKDIPLTDGEPGR